MVGENFLVYGSLHPTPVSQCIRIIRHKIQKHKYFDMPFAFTPAPPVILWLDHRTQVIIPLFLTRISDSCHSWPRNAWGKEQGNHWRTAYAV